MTETQMVETREQQFSRVFNDTHGGHIDLQYRRSWGVHWNGKRIDGAWRGRVVSNKNERVQYRITVYADTIADAAAALCAAVREEDERR